MTEFGIIIEVKELQLVEGEYFREQGNDYVMKWDNKVRIVPKGKVYTIHSDSSYFEVQYKERIKTWTRKNERWVPGKHETDTSYYLNRYILYRNLNE